MTFHETLVDYYNKMAKYRSSIGYTMTAYDSMLLPFIDYCGKEFSEATYITKNMVDGYLCRKTFKRINTRSLAISMIRMYARYIRGLGGAAFIPDEEYLLPREMFVPYSFSDTQLRALFHAFDTYKSPSKAYRDDILAPVIFRMDYCCGMRPGEPLRLRREDVNLQTGDVYIRKTKSNKDRHIIMSNELTEICRKYDMLAGERQWFFQHKNGGPIPVSWQTRHMKICWRISGFSEKGDVRPYDLRHAFATRTIMRWIDEGRNVMELLPFLSTYMGHSSLHSTMYYIHLLPDRLRSSAGVDWSRFDGMYSLEEVSYEKD